jgi:hypothetical protein
MKRHLLSLRIFLCLAPAFSAQAVTDYSVGFDNGSLVAAKDKNISLQELNVFIKPTQIHAIYNFYNDSQTPIVKTMAFPFPGTPYKSVPHIQEPCFDHYALKHVPNGDCPFVDFHVKVNGKSREDFQYFYRAFDSDGKDIASKLVHYHIPPSSYAITGPLSRKGEFDEMFLYEKDENLKDRLDKLNLTPNWSNQRVATWKETFRSKQDLVMDLTYTPSYHQELGLDCARKYCFGKEGEEYVDDKCPIRKKEKDPAEVRAIHFVIQKTGDWKEGTIGHFHLEVAGNSKLYAGICFPEPMRLQKNSFVGDFYDFNPDQEIVVTYLVKPRRAK